MPRETNTERDARHEAIAVVFRRLVYMHAEAVALVETVNAMRDEQPNNPAAHKLASDAFDAKDRARAMLVDFFAEALRREAEHDHT